MKRMDRVVLANSQRWMPLEVPYKVWYIAYTTDTRDTVDRTKMKIVVVSDCVMPEEGLNKPKYC